MWGLIVEAGILVGDYVYHRWIDPPTGPQKASPVRELSTPRTDSGAPYPLVYGRTLVKAPILAWMSTPIAWINEGDTGPVQYGINMLLILGIPFFEGKSGLISLQIDTKKFSRSFGLDLGRLTPAGQSGTVVTAMPALTSAAGVLFDGVNDTDPGGNEGFVEFFDGAAAQQLVNADGDPVSIAGFVMTQTTTDGIANGGGASTRAEHNYNGSLDPDDVPGYRGFLSALLYGQNGLAYWDLRTDTGVPSLAFEIGSYPSATLGPSTSFVTGLTGLGKVGAIANGANPIDVVYDILTSPWAKLGLDSSLIDLDSFRAAATTLYNEEHSYSRSFEDGETAQDMIKEIMEQIDGTIFTRPSTGKIEVKLIRPDYDPATLPRINPSNCDELQGFSMGGWQGTPTVVRINFRDESAGYADDSKVARSGAQSSVIGQDEVQISMPGCTSASLAAHLAARELAARVRPIAKCSAIINRELYDVCPGDAVSVTWPEANISGMIFRVAGVNRGKLADGKIQLDLVQDYFYQWRDQDPVSPLGSALVTPASASNTGGVVG